MRKVFATIALLFAMLMPAFAATGVAQIKGVYSFSVVGVSQGYGYYSNKGVWTVVSKGCPITPQYNCQNLSFSKITVGTISFSGTGSAKFLSFKTYDASGRSTGGPVVGVAYKYTVTGFNGTLTIPGPKGGIVSLTLGAFNPAGVAQVVILLVPDTNPDAGVATLQ